MDNKKYRISVCIIAKPEEDISKCLDSLEKQTYPYSEIIVHRQLGRFPELRNKVIDKAKEEIIAFIDSDCYADKHWLEEINNSFKDRTVIGIFGRVSYEFHGKPPSVSTRIISNEGNDTMTANAAFRSKLLKEVRFDEEINYLEDVILAKRIKEKGTVNFNKNAVVFHQYQEWTFKSAVKYAIKVEDFLKANEKYGLPINKLGFIINPQHYLIIFFPPSLLIFHSIRSLKDLKIILAIYIEKVYTRILIWKYAIKNKKIMI
jgi:glycosyltransferase involved in cell wall biosynthesis